MNIVKYYIDKIQGTDKAVFIKKIIWISNVLKINPNWLLLVIDSETGGKFSSTVKNPYSGAVGLIQFMPATAIGLNTSIEKLAKMPRVKQLDYVYLYYKNWIERGYKIQSYEDLYLLTFYPYAINKSDNYILGSEVSYERAKAIAKQNPLDYNNDGVISKGEFKKFIYRKNISGKIPKSQHKQLVNSPNNIKKKLWRWEFAQAC